MKYLQRNLQERHPEESSNSSNPEKVEEVPSNGSNKNEVTL